MHAACRIIRMHAGLSGYMQDKGLYKYQHFFPEHERCLHRPSAIIAIVYSVVWYLYRYVYILYASYICICVWCVCVCVVYVVCGACAASAY